MDSRQVLVLRCLQKPTLQFRIYGPKGILGREDICDFVVNHSSVSRRHAELNLVEERLEIVDIGSRNGTYLDETKVESCQLKIGQRIRFGAVDFCLESEPISDDDSTREGIDEWVDQIPRSMISSNLTRVKARVLELLLKGLQEKEIAEKMNRSAFTIHTHVMGIYRIYGVHNRGQLYSLFGRIS